MSESRPRVWHRIATPAIAAILMGTAACGGGDTPGGDNGGPDGGDGLPSSVATTTNPPDDTPATGAADLFLNIRPTTDQLECAYVPGGSLTGGDSLTIFYSLRADSAHQLDRLVPIRATSDTGLVATANSGVSGGPAQATVQLTLRSSDFGRTHRVLIVADPDNVIAETDDSDNQITVVVSLPSPRPTTTVDPLPCSPG